MYVPGIFRGSPGLGVRYPEGVLNKIRDGEILVHDIAGTAWICSSPLTRDFVNHDTSLGLWVELYSASVSLDRYNTSLSDLTYGVRGFVDTLKCIRRELRN